VLGAALAGPGGRPAAGRRGAGPSRCPGPRLRVGGLGYAGVISMFSASLAWYRGLAAGGTARIGQLNLAQPLLAIGWLALLGEHITWPAPVTAAIVLCCMAVNLRSAPARSQTKAPLASQNPAALPVTRQAHPDHGVP
jgi:EamA-like transporter family